MREINRHALNRQFTGSFPRRRAGDRATMGDLGMRIIERREERDE